MNIVCIGAHPDDAEVHAGGTCARWAKLGHRVLLVSMTNGDIGHYTTAGGPLAARREAEARASALRGGCEHRVFGYHDGELLPTLEARRQVVRLIREWQADIVLTHRPNDYHPDHRYCSVLVQDAAFMVTVPHFCPESPRLEKNPLFLYMQDRFQKPYPFRPDIAIDIGPAMTVKLSMLDAMESQMYEWLPWLHGRLDDVPNDPAARRTWLAAAWAGYFDAATAMARPGLAKWYGRDRAQTIAHAEAFEVCEYGHQPDEAELRAYFPFIDSDDGG